MRPDLAGSCTNRRSRAMGVRGALADGRVRAAARAAARGAGHRDRGARPRAARGRGEDGGRAAAHLGHDRRRQPGAVGGGARACADRGGRRRAGDERDAAVRPRPGAAWRAVLRGRGHAAVRAAAAGARDRDLRDRARRAPSWRWCWRATTSSCTWSTPAGVGSTRWSPSAPWPGAPPPRRRAGAGARRAARGQPRADHDARPRRGRRALRRRPALRPPGVDRVDRFGREVEPVRAQARRRGPRRGRARPHHHPDRAARRHRQGARHDRGERGGGPAATAGARGHTGQDRAAQNGRTALRAPNR